MVDLSLGCANKYPVHGTYTFKFGNESLTICEHDFDSAIETQEPSKEGWSGFCLQYHCHEPWIDSEWVISDLEELLKLLSNGIPQVEQDYFSKRNCKVLQDFLIRAKSSDNNVSIIKE